ncbi:MULTISPECIES: hypothetical protein [Bacteria]|nr:MULTISPECIES: hypothetical protein [Bacteria]
MAHLDQLVLTLIGDQTDENYLDNSNRVIRVALQPDSLVALE